MLAIRDEYKPRFGRQVLTVWSGAFASDYEGEALELPRRNGYMVRLAYSSVPVRVICESPRTEANYLRVDAAISNALQNKDSGNAAIALLAAFPILAAFAYVIGALIGMTR